MEKTNDGYISESATHWFRMCNELGIYMKSKETFKIERTHLTDKEFKQLCYNR